MLHRNTTNTNTTTTSQAAVLLPATHPATLARRGKLPTDVPATEVVQQVYAPGFKAVLNIPASVIRHLPPVDLRVTRLVLCANYSPHRKGQSCPLGDRCRFVHADIDAKQRRQLTQHEIHVNYAWRNVESVTYARHSSADTSDGAATVRVALPNAVRGSEDEKASRGAPTTVEMIPVERLLVTKALTSVKAGKTGTVTLRHCAHYHFNRTCNMGSDCQFVHAVFIDPEAKPHQRAPPPYLLRQHHHHEHGTTTEADHHSHIHSGRAALEEETHSEAASWAHGESDESGDDSATHSVYGRSTTSSVSSVAKGWRHNPYLLTEPRHAVMVAVHA